MYIQGQAFTLNKGSRWNPLLTVKKRTSHHWLSAKKTFFIEFTSLPGLLSLPTHVLPTSSSHSIPWTIDENISSVKMSLAKYGDAEYKIGK